VFCALNVTKAVQPPHNWATDLALLTVTLSIISVVSFLSPEHNYCRLGASESLSTKFHPDILTYSMPVLLFTSQQLANNLLASVKAGTVHVLKSALVSLRHDSKP
jgi:hypothetical protein